MTDFGVQPSGFVLKRLEDIKASFEARLKSVFGPGINLSPTGVFGQLTAEFVKVVSDLWELGQDTYDARNPDAAEDAALDDIVAYLALKRLAATKSFVDQTFVGSNGAVVPVNRNIGVDGTEDKFENLTAVTIDQALTRQKITITEAINTAVHVVTIDTVPHQYVAGLLDTTSTIAAGLAQVINSFSAALVFARAVANDLYIMSAKPGDAFTINSVAMTVSYTIVTVDIALNTLSVNGDVTAQFGVGQAFTAGGITPSALTVQSSVLLAGKTVITTNEDITAGAPGGLITRNVGFTNVADNTFGKVAQVSATIAGAVLAPARALTRILTPVSGWESTHNSVSATPGRDLETNQQLRLRRVRSTSLPGSATVEAILAAILQVSGVSDAFVYENDTGTTDGLGVPEHSIYPVVVGGDDTAIAQTIFNKKSAGIGTFGAVGPITITDSKGIDHLIKFGRPTIVPIYLVYDITLNSEQGNFPSGGDDVIKENAVEIGNDTFGIGRNVAPFLLIAAVNVPGVSNVVLKLQRDAPPGGGDTGPITIDPDEVAEFAVIRVTVNHV